MSPKRRRSVSVCLSILIFTLAAPRSGAQDLPPPAPPQVEPALRGPITVSDWLVLGPVPGWGRRPFAPSPVARRYLLSEGAEPPREGETIPWPRAGSLAWRRLEGDAARALGNGYAFATVVSPGPARAILEGKGTTVTYLNGDPVVGDVYHRGRLRAPVRLRKGENHILARAVRGDLEVKLVPPAGPLDFNLKDATLPHHRIGEPLDGWGAVPLLNTLDDWITGAVIEVGGGGHFEKTSQEVPPLAPLGICKVPFRIRCREGWDPVPSGETSLDLPLAVRWEGGEARTTLRIGIRKMEQTYSETFISGIDGSVQYYAVRPPLRIDPDWRYGLILSLHGAGVRARGQADAYAPKEWAFVVAPTNRRPFGFDWEDWGRIDALEVLAEVQARYPIDPDRVTLSGHSMGGHGVWHLGVTDPGRFAAIAPSAGWISFWSYGSGNLRKDADPMEALFWRATSTSDTLSLLWNLREMPVFIIHGEKDDNVPPREAREMVRHLEKFHEDFVYREFPGQGHWWNIGETPGTDCVDLADLWKYVFPRRRDRFPKDVYFTTMDPGTSHRRAWVEILAQGRSHERSSIRAKADPDERTFEVTTENATAIGLDLRGLVLSGPVKIRIDGEMVETEWAGEARLTFVREGDRKWRRGPPPGGPRGKGPERSGPFKRVFGNRFVMVVGTGGSEGERRAALRRARMDAQVWWYRANGQAVIVPDKGFDPDRYRGRNWILYGHAGMNEVLARMAAGMPVCPERGAVTVGETRIEGDGLACLAIAPHPDDPRSLIGVAGGTDAKGITLGGFASIIRSGIGYPDFCVWSDAVLDEGLGGIVAAGFLDASWKVDPQDTLIRQEY